MLTIENGYIIFFYKIDLKVVGSCVVQLV